MGDGSTCTSEKLQSTENDKVINVHISDRPRARERESSDQQGSFIQCASSEKLSTMNGLERVYSIDISHDYRGHADLAVVLLRDGFDGTRFEEILRNPTFDFVSVNHIPAFVIKSFPAGFW